MENVFSTGKRAFSAAIAAATIAFTIGAGSLVAPATADAASSGDLIKGTSLTTVYYQGYDGLRYTFPNEKTYFSWYQDFSDVVTISDSALAAITLGGNVVVRPGTWWIKVQSDPKVYAVARDGSIHWVESEAVAVDFAGSNWNQRIIDVPDVFFDDYTVGTSLMSADAYEGMLYEMGGSTYLVWDGEMRLVTSAGMSANGFDSMFVMDGSGIDDSGLSAGDDVTSAELALIDAAQTEEGGAIVGGDITVSLSSSTPAGMTLPGRTNAVELMSFNVKAGAEAAELNSVTLKMIGAGATSNIANVYLYNGDERLTEARSVNSSTRQVTFSNLNLAVGAGDDVTLTVRAEIAVAQTASDTIGFEISEDTDVVASGDVGGSFPVSGNIFTMSGSDAGWLEVDKSGSIINPTLGEQDAVIGTFKVTTNSEAASVQSVTLKVDNASDHSNFWLWDGTVALAEGSNVSGDLVMFDLSSSPFAIDEGSSNIFSVSADVGGQSADTVKVYVDNRVDIVAEGGDFGFGMCVDTGSTSCTSSAAVGSYDGSSCTSASGNCSYSTIQGGELTLVGNGPSAGDIQVNGKDQVLLNFSMSAAQDVTIKDLDVIVGGEDDGNGLPFTPGDDSGSDNDGLINTNGEGNLTDIKIINADTGAVIMGPLELDCVTTTCGADGTNDGTQTIDFTDDFSLSGGETLNLAITADVDNNVTSGTDFGAKIDISGLSAEDVNGDALTTSDIVPSGDIQGFAQEANAASLVVALASTPGDVTTVRGTDNVHVQSFNFTAGDGGDVLVNTIQVSVYSADVATFGIGDETNVDVNDFIESCVLTDSAGVVLDGPETPVSTGETMDFNNVDWTVHSGESKVLKVACSFANPSTGSDADAFAFDLADLSEDVVAEDEDGNDVDPTTDGPNGTTTPTNVVTVNASGTLTVSADSSTPSADLLLTSTNDNHVASYRFTAANEGFNVNVLTFSEEQAEDDTNSTNSTAYTNNLGMVTIEYPKADGSTGSKTVSVTGNEAKFSALDMYVAPNDPGVVDVFVNVPLTARDSGGSATSNEKVRMGLFVDTTNDDNYKAVGAGSGTTLDDDDQGAIGDDAYATDGIATFVVRETKPTITLSSSSPSGAKVPGDQEALRFNVAASANEDLVFKNILFKISASDNATSLWDDCDTDATATTLDAGDFDFYNLSEQGTAQALDVDADWTGMTATGANCTTTTGDLVWERLSLTTEEIVPKGQTYTYSLWVDASLASAANDDSLQVELATDPILASASFLTASDLTESNVTSTDTTLSVTSGAAYAVGDVICMDTADDACGAADEKMLVVGIATNDLTVVRGYLATAPDTGSLNDAADDVDRVPGAFLWQDDGTTAVTTGAEERYGAHLVDNLPVTGGALVF